VPKLKEKNFTVTMIYSIFAGPDKDYYLDAETKAEGQQLGIYKKVLIGDKMEDEARV
jgi:hypothetical protein